MPSWLGLAWLTRRILAILIYHHPYQNNLCAQWFAAQSVPARPWQTLLAGRLRPAQNVGGDHGLPVATHASCSLFQRSN